MTSNLSVLKSELFAYPKYKVGNHLKYQLEQKTFRSFSDHIFSVQSDMSWIFMSAWASNILKSVTDCSTNSTPLAMAAFRMAYVARMRGVALRATAIIVWSVYAGEVQGSWRQSSDGFPVLVLDLLHLDLSNLRCLKHCPRIEIALISWCNKQNLFPRSCFGLSNLNCAHYSKTWSLVESYKFFFDDQIIWLNMSSSELSTFTKGAQRDSVCTKPREPRGNKGSCLTCYKHLWVGLCFTQM